MPEEPSDQQTPISTSVQLLPGLSQVNTRVWGHTLSACSGHGFHSLWSTRWLRCVFTWTYKLSCVWDRGLALFCFVLLKKRSSQTILTAILIRLNFCYWIVNYTVNCTLNSTDCLDQLLVDSVGNLWWLRQRWVLTLETPVLLHFVRQILLECLNIYIYIFLFFSLRKVGSCCLQNVIPLQSYNCAESQSKCNIVPNNIKKKKNLGFERGRKKLLLGQWNRTAQ